MQTNEANKSEFPKVSPERFVRTRTLWSENDDIAFGLLTRCTPTNRAFTDYVFCSVILHFFCINFIN